MSLYCLVASSLRAGTLPLYGGQVKEPKTNNTGFVARREDRVQLWPSVSFKVKSIAGSPFLSATVKLAWLVGENSWSGQSKQFEFSPSSDCIQLININNSEQTITNLMINTSQVNFSLSVRLTYFLFIPQ